MSLELNIRPSSTKRRIASAVAVLGAILVASQLAGIWPREVEVEYLLDGQIRAVEVDYVQAGETVSSARFSRAALGGSDVRHRVRLQPGEYQALITVYRADGTGVEQSRTLIVPIEGLTRFDLREPTGGSD
jgi:hypothetical protein